MPTFKQTRVYVCGSQRSYSTCSYTHIPHSHLHSYTCTHVYADTYAQIWYAFICVQFICIHTFMACTLSTHMHVYTHALHVHICTHSRYTFIQVHTNPLLLASMAVIPSVSLSLPHCVCLPLLLSLVLPQQCYGSELKAGSLFSWLESCTKCLPPPF